MGKTLRQVLGGGSDPINSFRAFNETADQFTDSEGSEWLKTGLVSTDSEMYPKATSFISGVEVEGGFSFSAAANDSSIQGLIYTDETFFGGGATPSFWVTGKANDLVIRYDATDGSYISSFSVAAQTSAPSGIACDGNSFYVSDSSSANVYIYDSSGVYQGSFSTGYSNGTGIAYDGAHLYGINGSNNVVYKFTLAGASAGSFTLSGASITAGSKYSISWDGTYLWIGLSGGKFYRFTAAGDYADLAIPVSGTGYGNGLAILENGNFLLSNGASSVAEFEVTSVIGIPSVAIDSDTGRTMYTRIG